MPVAATPAPMTTVPLRSSQSRTRVARPDLLRHDRIAVAAARAERERQQERGQEQRDRQDDVARQDDREERAEVHGPGRSTSSATHSVSSVRSRIRSPAAANARRTSGSRSTWMPDASRRPPLPGRPSPGRTAADSSTARSTSRPATRFARTRSNGPPSTGRLPRVTSIRTTRCARAFAAADSTAIGSVSTPRTDARRPSAPRRPRGCPDPRPDVEDRARHRPVPRPPSARGPRGRAGSWGAARSRRPCPGRG